MEFFVSVAHAQAAGGGGGGGFDAVGFFVPLIGIFAIMYFLIIRPQQRRMKEHQAMIDAVRRGDEIITSGGILGKVTRVREGEEEVEVEIADGVRVRVLRAMIANVVSKTEPAKAEPSRSGGPKPKGKNRNRGGRDEGSGGETGSSQTPANDGGGAQEGDSSSGRNTTQGGGAT